VETVGGENVTGSTAGAVVGSASSSSFGLAVRRRATENKTTTTTRVTKKRIIFRLSIYVLVLLRLGDLNPNDDDDDDGGPAHLPTVAPCTSVSRAKLMIFPLNVTSLMQPTNDWDIEAAASMSDGTPPK